MWTASACLTLLTPSCSMRKFRSRPVTAFLFSLYTHTHTHFHNSPVRAALSQPPPTPTHLPCSCSELPRARREKSKSAPGCNQDCEAVGDWQPFEQMIECVKWGKKEDKIKSRWVLDRKLSQRVEWDRVNNSPRRKVIYSTEVVTCCNRTIKYQGIKKEM